MIGLLAASNGLMAHISDTSQTRPICRQSRNAYMEHRLKDWVDAKGHYLSKNPFWIDLWDSELLGICEDIDLDDHP
jgi:hypothetical protein